MMGSFTTINKIDENNLICKYETFETQVAADARVLELHQIAGYEGAFVVDNVATAGTNGEMCFQAPLHFPVNMENQTVTFDQAAYDADALAVVMTALRDERDIRLAASDINVLPDRTASMDEATKTAWNVYRQELRDFPESADTDLWPDVAWPDAPA